MTKRWMIGIALLAAIYSSAVFAQGGTANAGGHLESARALFDRYVALERSFDPAMADLYAVDALIRNRRTYPTGQVRELTIPAPQYKALMRQAMPLAKAQDDTNRYSDCAYSPEGERVRIKCARYSERKNYSSPMELLVGPGPAGRWVVFAELSESRP